MSPNLAYLSRLILSCCLLAVPAGCSGSAQPGNSGAPNPAGGWQIALPAGGASARSTAATGAEFIDLGGNIHLQNDMLLLRTEGSGSGEYSYGVYALDLAGAQPQRVIVDCFFDIQPVSPGSAIWIGLGDYSAGRWDWRGPYSDSPLVLDCAEPRFISPAGTLVIAAVVTGGADCYLAQLDANPHVLEIWPGHFYDRIEDAVPDATDGAWILVHPQDGGAAYSQPALLVQKAGLHFRAVLTGGARVALDGAGFNYSGADGVPRAIFQIDPAADGCSIAGFELREAHNETYNGAGVRINQANTVTVRNCEIHDNDMGIMSSGSLSQVAGVDQLIEYCQIHHNGNLADPGSNHNLYLGGVSACIRACEIYSSLTGHNIKSRARRTFVEFCYVHDSANREFDLVDDAENTAQLGSDAVLIGNVIVKDPACSGNHAVIHFGQDGGFDRYGDVWLVHNTVVTPFISPVLTLSAPNAGAKIYNNIIWDNGSGQSGQQLLQASGGALLNKVSGGYNWLASGQNVAPGTLIEEASDYHAAAGENPPFSDPLHPDPAQRDFHLLSAAPGITDTSSNWHSLGLPAAPRQEDIIYMFEYLPRASMEPRPDDSLTDRGAYEYAP